MKHTYSEIVNDWDLWREYVDTAGTMTRKEFDSMKESEKLKIIVSCFGGEEWSRR